MPRSTGSTPRKFHVHFESNSSKPRQFQVLESDVKAAARRHPELAHQLKITVGFDRKILADALQSTKMANIQHCGSKRMNFLHFYRKIGNLRTVLFGR